MTRCPDRACAGLAIAGAACVWYVYARAAAYHGLYHRGWLKSLASASLWFVLTGGIILVVAVLLMA